VKGAFYWKFRLHGILEGHDTTSAKRVANLFAELGVRRAEDGDRFHSKHSDTVIF
jgi:hypothetical protein